MAHQVFETSVFNRKLVAEGRMLFVPRDVSAELGPSEVSGETVLGVRLGVPIPDAEGLVDVLYASLQGRVSTFDAESFGRWRPRWQQDRSEESLFAKELVFGERVPVQTSPLRLDSMASLASKGEAYVTNGAEWAYHHPLQALGVVLLTQGSLLFVGLSRMARRTIIDAAEYRLRRPLGLPDDWLPPGDR
jgi:hypothetical protein